LRLDATEHPGNFNRVIEESNKLHAQHEFGKTSKHWMSDFLLLQQKLVASAAPVMPLVALGDVLA
jgi:hypothetical protein